MDVAKCKVRGQNLSTQEITFMCLMKSMCFSILEF